MLSTTAARKTNKKSAPTRKRLCPRARSFIRPIFPTSSSIPNLFQIRPRSNPPLYAKGTATWAVPSANANNPLIQPIARTSAFESDAPEILAQLPLRLSLWRLLLLLFFARCPQRTNIGLHLLALFRRQQFYHLHARAVPQLMSLRSLLIRCQRRIVVQRVQLRFCRLVNLLHLRFLVVGQVQSFHRAMHASFVLRWRGRCRLALILCRRL